VRDTTLQTPRSVKKEGGGGAQHVGAESLPLQLVIKTMVRQVVPLQPTEVHGGADLHLQPVEGTPRWSRGMPEGGCDPMGSPRWSRFAGRACDPVGDPHWSSLFLKNCTLWKGPTLGQFVKSCTLWEGLTLEKFVENCVP